jgi:hypothetical protein
VTRSAGSRGRVSLRRVVLSRAGLRLCRGRRGRATLPLLDRRDELTLAHPAGSLDAHRLRHLLQLGQQLRGQPAAAAATRSAIGGGKSRRRGPRDPVRARRAGVRGIRGGDPARAAARAGRGAGRGDGVVRGGEEFGGIAHKGSFQGRPPAAPATGGPGFAAWRLCQAKVLHLSAISTFSQRRAIARSRHRGPVTRADSRCIQMRGASSVLGLADPGHRSVPPDPVSARSARLPPGHTGYGRRLNDRSGNEVPQSGSNFVDRATRNWRAPVPMSGHLVRYPD